MLHLSEDQQKIQLKANELSKEKLNPTNDVLFKFIFGRPERKQITIAFLNDLLYEELGHKIKDLIFENTEQTPNSDNGKLTRLDIACVLDSGEKVDIEMQVAYEKSFTNRTLYYWSQMYLGSILNSEDYGKLTPCICINILDFVLFKDEPSAFTSYAIFERKSHALLNGDLNLHFLEIPKFQKKEHMTKMERWLAMFSKKLSYQEKMQIAKEDPMMHNMLKSYDAFFLNNEERLKYINRQMAIYDYKTAMRSSRETGLAEGEAIGLEKGEAIGLEKGRKEGIAQAKEQTVLTLVKKGMTLKNAMEILDMSEQEQSEIIKKHPELNEASK